MTPSTDTEVERHLKEALKNEKGVWTPQCLDSETLFDLSEQEGHFPNSEEYYAHIATCQYCFREFRDLSEALHISRLLEAAAIKETVSETAVTQYFTPRPVDHSASQNQPGSAELSPGSNSNPSKRAGPSWIAQVSESVTRLKELLQPRTLSYAFSDREEIVEQRRPLTFDDPDALGSVLRENGETWMKFNHRQWSVGSLVIFEVTDESGAVFWNQFALLKKGFRQATVELKIEDETVLLHRQLSVASVEASRLPESVSELLLFSYQNDVEISLAHRQEWQHWATSVLQTPLKPEIQRAVEAIAIA